MATGKPISVASGIGGVWSRLQAINPNIPPIPKFEDAVAKAKAETEKAEREQAQKIVKNRQEHRKRKVLGGSHIPERYQHCSFDNYQIYGDERQVQALQFAKTWVSDFKGQQWPKGFIFTGETGTGKNHLAAAMCLSIIEAGGTAKLVSVAGLNLHRREVCFDAEHKIPERQFIRDLSKIDLLILDEIGMGNNTRRDDFFDQVVHARSDAGNPTGIISNLSMESLQRYLGPRNIDRITENGGSAISFTWPSYRQKVFE